MALEFVGGKAVNFAGTLSATTISLTDLTGGLAAAPAAGDIVIVGYCVGSNGDVAIGVNTAGYTEEQELFSDDSGDTNLSVSWKIMGGTPDTSVEVSTTTATNFPGAVGIHVWRGADTSTPFDVAETTATGGNTAQPNPASITPTTAGAVVIAIGGGCSQNGATYTSSDLSNFFTAAETASTRDAMVGIGSFAWTSGAFDPAQFGGGATDGADSWAAVTLALRPQTTTHYTITADAGSFALTGSAATLKAARKVVAAAGAYALTGIAATLKADRRLLAGTLPTFVAAGTAADGVGDVVVPAPASIEAGDLLILAVETADEAVTAPSGWTEHPDSPVIGDNLLFGASRLTIFYKFTDGTDTEATITDPGDHALGAMIAVRNAGTSNPFGDSATNQSGALPAITPSTRGTLVVAFYAKGDDTGFAGFNWDNIPVAVETERVNATTTDGNDGSLGIWSAPFLQQSLSNATTGQFSASGAGTAPGMHFVIAPAQAPGEFTVTGSAATLRRGYKLAAAAGSFALTGVAATLRAARKITAEAGSFALTGEDAALRKGFTLLAEAGECLLTGAAAGSRRTYVWAVEAGAFALSGAAAALRAARKIVADAGQFILTGADVEFDAIQRELTDEPSTERIFCVDGEDRTVVIEAERERIFTCSACQPRVTTVEGSRPRITVLEAGSSRTVTLPPEERRTIA